MKMRKAAFFDRDGTLIKDASYLSSLDQVELIMPAVKIAQECQRQGYLLFIVTNQSGIARGLYDEAFVHTTHAYLSQLLSHHGVSIEKYYYCPHHPIFAAHDRYRIDCHCRKPKPGMLLEAAAAYNLDLSASVMFGNEQKDIEAGLAAGCKAIDITQLFAKSPESCVTLWSL
jgi:D-glycero-D-manno-heptose 1,7-bisphosphate phosphatase